MSAADPPAIRLADYLGLRDDGGARVKRFGEIELRISGDPRAPTIDVHAGLARWLDTYQVASFDGSRIMIAGQGEQHRITALLDGEAAELLMELPPMTTEVSDFGVRTKLTVPLAIEAQSHLVGVVVQLAGAIERAAANVSVAAELVSAVPPLRRAAEAHQLALTPCPLGLLGSLGGCAVDLFRFRPERHRHLAFIHVSVPGVEPGGWLVNARHPKWGARTSGAIAAMFRRGPRTGSWKFDRRFQLVHGRRVRLGRDAASLLANTADEYAVSIDAGKIVVGLPLLDQRRLAGVTELIGQLVEAARLMGTAAEEDATAAGPYR
ncbi:MAG: hypothetical protein WKG01_20020 [Kofleriaceae bacterium]